MKRLLELSPLVLAWHEEARRPFYTCGEVRGALRAGSAAYAPVLRVLGWVSRRVRFYETGQVPRLRVVWVPPGGSVARKRGRPLKSM